ncbi:MAG TPA: acetate--CoA ligase family protein [Actinomycetota bacterium]|nr:acetate--CoA ligase family protein [Actinomycetota bacterium]
MTPLEHMLEARSVAVVGASVKPGSLGAAMMAELRRGGFDGEVLPVNPGYDEIDGYRCFASIGEAPGPVDLAILGVANQRLERALTDAAEAGARSAVTFSSLHEEPDERPSPDAPPLRDRLAAIARAHGMALCGGNGMGFCNEAFRLRATGFATPDHLRHGPVTFISHSGSAFAALAFNDRGIGFDLLVSSGQEIVTTMDEYMAYALDHGRTRVLSLLLETVRNPDGLRAQLARALELEVPVIALKVGRTEPSKAMVTAHSGALAGEHGAYEALFDAYGVHEVRSLDEMADAMELFSSPRRVTAGRGIASIHDSGGERAMFVDLASDLGVPFAQVSDATLKAIDDTLDPGLEAANPLDAWGTGIDADRIFRESFLALAADDDTAAVAFVVDLTRQGEPYDEGYLQIAIDVWNGTTKPFCVVSNLASAVDHHEVTILRDRGIPVLEGTTSGLLALRHLLDHRDVAHRGGVPAPPAAAGGVRERWRDRLTSQEPFSEVDGLALLRDYGIPTVDARPARSLEGAVGAADLIGYPVALKTAAPGIAHKSDVGGVRLGLAGAEDVREAYASLAESLGPEVTVAAMAEPGVEVALGVVHDPMFGPLVLVAAGGVLVELLKDRKLGLPPLDEAAALRLIDGLASRPLLDGFRGAPPADVGALAHTVSRLSVLAADLGDAVAALDVNPVVVSASGCVAVDALVEPAR